MQRTRSTPGGGRISSAPGASASRASASGGIASRASASGGIASRTSASGASRHGDMGPGELMLIGLGGIIGAGFFLGVGLPIRTAGPSVLLAFVFGAIITFEVTGAITSIAIKHPDIGSFQRYAQLYSGPFAGYLEGWTYYLTSILTIASEAVAMAIFVRLWLPRMPVPVAALTFVVVILLINAFGVRSFGYAESFMSIIKVAALAGFIIFIAIALFAFGHRATGWSAATAGAGHVRGTAAAHAGSGIGGITLASLFPHGIGGVLQSMLIVIFAFAGIGVFVTAVPQAKRTRDINTGAFWTLIVLTALYLGSVACVLLIQPWDTVNTTLSPLVEALRTVGAGSLAGVLNGVVLVASFSVMAGSVFSANQVLRDLGASRQAPHFVTTASRRNVPFGALAVTALGIVLAVAVAFVLPANVYNLLISASSFLTFLYWGIMLWTFMRWRRTQEGRVSRTSPLAFGGSYGAVATLCALLLLTVFALFQKDQRIAFYVFAVLTVIVAAGYLWVKRQLRT